MTYSVTISEEDFMQIIQIMQFPNEENRYKKNMKFRLKDIVVLRNEEDEYLENPRYRVEINYRNYGEYTGELQYSVEIRAEAIHHIYKLLKIKNVIPLGNGFKQRIKFILIDYNLDSTYVITYIYYE